MEEKLEYKKYLDLKLKYEEKVNRIAGIRLITFFILIMSFILKYYYYPIFFQVVFFISLFSFLILIVIHDKYFKLFHYYEQYFMVIENYCQRKRGEWKNFSDTGEEFLDEKNNYLRDLDVLGKNSLFQYLSVCKTLGGKRILSKKLSNPKLSAVQLKEEQLAIKEISQNKKFMIDYQVELMAYENKEMDLGNVFSMYAKENSSLIHDYFLAIVCSILLFVFLGLAFFQVIQIQYFYGLFLFNYALSFMYSLIYQEDFEKITRFIRTYHQIPLLAEVIERENFSSSKLFRIKKEVSKVKKVTKKLQLLDTLNSIKDNLLFNFLGNGFFCINLISRSYFFYFLKKYFPQLKVSIFDIEEIEAFISLAGIGLLKEEVCLPSRVDEVEIRMEGIKHPLLAENVCVANDFVSGANVNIITGSNMGGKTSFLRTVGINLILMNAGTFVCASSFSASYFKIFTSMRVGDDIEKGISTFYGELLRIKEAMEYLEKGNMLVLIDEIFKGTNYQDRIYGAKKVIQKLQNKQVITLLTTHDFELCDEKNITNYHVKEYYVKDQIRFDYKIRKGKCTSTNAKYLMEKLGII
mgnify:CR=1 FL=1